MISPSIDDNLSNIQNSYYSKIRFSIGTVICVEFDRYKSALKLQVNESERCS